MDVSTINVCMILHLNANIFECFWVLHNKELVTKLSSTSCRLDIIIDAYRTGPREMNFMLLQFHWFKLKSRKRSLYHAGRKKVSIHGWWQLCLCVLWKCIDVLSFLPRVSSPSSIPCTAILQHQTSASSSSSSIPGLWYFPCFLAFASVLEQWQYYSLERCPCPQKPEDYCSHWGFLQSCNHPFPALDLGYAMGFQLTIEELSRLAWLASFGWHPQNLHVLVHIPLPPSFSIPAPLYASFSSSKNINFWVQICPNTSC